MMNMRLMPESLLVKLYQYLQTKPYMEVKQILDELTALPSQESEVPVVPMKVAEKK